MKRKVMDRADEKMNKYKKDVGEIDTQKKIGRLIDRKIDRQIDRSIAR